jgi:arginine/lysine/ornithine decarboxylase
MIVDVPAASRPLDRAFTLDHRRAPLVDGLRRYKSWGMAPFATPGHKLGVGADPELVALYGAEAFASDIPVSGGADDIHFREGVLREAEALGADAWAADRCFYLVNGSSAGNHAYLLAALRPGDEVVVARDIHKSLLVAMILVGARPIYVAPALHPEQHVGLGVEPAAIAAALDAHPDAKLVALVSPSYCGVQSDVAGIVAVAHARGVPVYVDEAWGPHFAFHPDLPASAMQSGADGAVCSTHKVLGAITQSAILNVRAGLVAPDHVATLVGMAQTTSPAVLILASIDACRRQMVREGRALLDRTIELAQDARRRLRAIPGVSVLGADLLGLPSDRYDPTKLVIDVHGLGLTGFELEHLLRDRYRINPEMSDLVGIECLVTVGDTTASVERLVQAFADIAREGMRGPEKAQGAEELGAALRSSGAIISPGEQAMSPRDAFFAPKRAVALSEAVGAVAAELVIPYPPGIPVLAPGDVISAEKIEYLRYGAARGMYVSGPADDSLATIRVVA